MEILKQHKKRNAGDTKIEPTSAGSIPVETQIFFGTIFATAISLFAFDGYKSGFRLTVAENQNQSNHSATHKGHKKTISNNQKPK